MRAGTNKTTERTCCKCLARNNDLMITFIIMWNCCAQLTAIDYVVIVRAYSIQRLVTNKWKKQAAHGFNEALPKGFSWFLPIHTKGFLIQTLGQIEKSKSSPHRANSRGRVLPFPRTPSRCQCIFAQVKTRFQLFSICVFVHQQNIWLVQRSHAGLKAFILDVI